MYTVKNKLYNFTIDAIVMGGQSNEAGGSGMGTPTSTYLTSQPNTWIFDKNNDRSSTDNGRIQNLLYGQNQNWDSAHYTTNGPEISCGLEYNSQTGKPLLIIKYAQGSSALVDDGSTITANGIWQIDADVTRASNLLHYTILVQYFIIPCIQKLRSKGINVRIKAFHWCQGETDSQTLARANDYENQLTRLINKLITDLTPYNVLASNFRTIITRTNINTTGATYINAIRTAQTNVASAFSGNIINSDSYTLDALLHYVAASQVQHGIDIANILVTL